MKKVTGRIAAVSAAVVIAASAVSVGALALNRIKGDVTGDGKVTQADAVWAARKADGQDIGDAAFDELAADVDLSGKFDTADAEAIAKYVAGWDDTPVGGRITDSDPVYTLSIKYRDDIDKSVQDNELEDAVADDEELMIRYFDGEFDDSSKFTKVRGGLTLEEAYALARKFPDFNVDIDAGGEKAPMIITEDIDGFTNDENITSVTLTAKVAGGKAPYTYKWYKGGSEAGTNGTYTSGVTGDNYDKEVYCLITDADGKTIETNKTKLKNTIVHVYAPLEVKKIEGFYPYTFVPNGHDVGYNSLEYDYVDTTDVTVTVEGGKAPYKYQWYVDSEPNFGPYTTGYMIAFGGIVSDEPSCTIKYAIDEVFGKECKCVVTDALGNTVESESDKIRYCYHGTDPLVKYTPSGYSSSAYAYSMNDDYYITAYFQGGSCAWRQYKARINILTEENGKRQFKEFESIYYTGTNKFRFEGNRLEYTGKKSAMQKEGLINTLNNCQVVITDPLTNSTLSYLLTLN